MTTQSQLHMSGLVLLASEVAAHDSNMTSASICRTKAWTALQSTVHLLAVAGFVLVVDLDKKDEVWITGVTASRVGRDLSCRHKWLRLS